MSSLQLLPDGLFVIAESQPLPGHLFDGLRVTVFASVLSTCLSKNCHSSHWRPVLPNSAVHSSLTVSGVKQGSGSKSAVGKIQLSILGVVYRLLPRGDEQPAAGLPSVHCCNRPARPGNPFRVFQRYKTCRLYKNWLQATGERSLHIRLDKYKKNRQINLHFFPWPAVCTPTFLPCSGSIKKKTSLMQITTYTN